MATNHRAANANRGRTNRILGGAAILLLRGLGALSSIGLMMNPVFASPPLTQKANPPHLDLRPVTSILAPEKASVNFPSAMHRQTLGAQDQIQLPTLGAEGPQARIPGRIEAFARRVHREGLPVARLWESKSALVSLGLNQKGKPGLWIVQKTR
jgi:hypothetical protein